MASLATEIRKIAEELGFAKVGFVAADVLVGEGERLREWIALGFHGQMEWLAREPEKRTDPRSIFPMAESVIVVALNYHTPHRHGVDPTRGKISRYAWGDDYHDVMRDRMSDLLHRIRTLVPAAEGKICIDTAPMMDKAWAVRAGLGWLGKHTNLITREVGSWVFIGEIIVNFQIDDVNTIVEDHCGSCTACLDACPTGAIVEPYVVDSRKCVSYATIELRDETLPGDVAAHLDGWLYGCDICQDVCPWNRFETPTNEARFEPRKGEISLDLVAVQSLSPEEYAERFRRSAIKRTKLTGLKRNAAALRSNKGS